MSTSSGTFSAVGNGDSIGEGPIFYRLRCSAYSSGAINYFFGNDTLTPPRRKLMLLTGTWVGTVVIQFSEDKVTWTDVPGESYTANASRYIQG